MSSSRDWEALTDDQDLQGEEQRKEDTDFREK